MHQSEGLQVPGAVGLNGLVSPKRYSHFHAYKWGMANTQPQAPMKLERQAVQSKKRTKRL